MKEEEGKGVNERKRKWRNGEEKAKEEKKQ